MDANLYKEPYGIAKLQLGQKIMKWNDYEVEMSQNIYEYVRNYAAI